MKFYCFVGIIKAATGCLSLIVYILILYHMRAYAAISRQDLYIQGGAHRVFTAIFASKVRLGGLRGERERHEERRTLPFG